MKIKKIEEVIYENPIPVYDVINAVPFHNFVSPSQDSAIVLHNCAMMDEMNFSRAGVKDINKAKTHMKDTFNTVVDRVKGTFRMNGEVYGKVFAVSSKKSDSDFMEDYIQQQLDAGAGDHMYVSDKPQWEVLPPTMFNPQKFYLAVGDRHKRGFVISEDNPSQEALDELINQGYTILTPPLDMKSAFIADFDIALRDLAGISVPGSLSFITQDTITQCIGTRKNPFLNDIIQIGTKDSYSLEEFYHDELVDPKFKMYPLYIHLDLSLNTDKTGISGVCISGRKDIVGDDGKTISQPTFSHVFSVSIEAPRGDKIPYAKITEFICWLRRKGYHMGRISRDQFQSEYMAQLLEAQGFDVDKISLDRTPDGYITLRSVLLEQRVDMLDCQNLQDEMIHLQRDALTGRVDHPVGGSKDVADSFAGSIWNCLLNNPAIPVPAKKVASAIAAVNGSRNYSNNGTQLPGLFSGIYKKY